MGEIKMPTQNSPSVSSQQSQYEIPAELQEVNYFIITEFELEMKWRSTYRGDPNAQTWIQPLSLKIKTLYWI